MNDAVAVAAVEDVESTGRDTVVAQWGVAVVVMTGSAISAGVGFGFLGEHPAIGVITGLGVDLALAFGLIIGRRLRAVGITTCWGSVLLWLTGLMTLCLNSGAAVLGGRWGLAVAHAFLPVLMVVLTEAGSEAQLKLHRLARERTAAQRAEQDARLAAERAEREAQQRQLRAEREEEARRLERGREIEAARHEREMADRREERERRDRELVGILAAVLALGAAWRSPRSRPSGASRVRPSVPSQARPRSARPGVPVASRAGVPVTEELMSQAQRVRARRLAEGRTAGRAVLARELNVPERTAKELVRRLGGQPLRVLSGGGR